jgi:hypothetical protein
MADWLDRNPVEGVRLSIFPTNRNIAAELSRVLTTLRPDRGGAGQQETPDEDSAHDAYFQVVRTRSDSPAVFVHSLVAAREIFLHETAAEPVGLSHSRLHAIDKGFADLTASVQGNPRGSEPYVSIWEVGPSECDSVSRWVRGHQVFAVLTQGLIYCFRALQQAIRAGNHCALQTYADLCIALLRASAAAFELTGDIPVEDYEEVIRPSMMPPQAPVSLSGLMSADHRFLAQTMRDMRPALKSLHEQEPARHDSISAALAEVYDSHIHVCERFVGGKPSLLTAGRTERSGPSLIEQFKTLRLKPFEQAQRAARVTPHSPNQSGIRCPFHD